KQFLPAKGVSNMKQNEKEARCPQQVAGQRRHGPATPPRGAGYETPLVGNQSTAKPGGPSAGALAVARKTQDPKGPAAGEGTKPQAPQNAEANADTMGEKKGLRRLPFERPDKATVIHLRVNSKLELVVPDAGQKEAAKGASRFKKRQNAPHGRESKAHPAHPQNRGETAEKKASGKTPSRQETLARQRQKSVRRKRGHRRAGLYVLRTLGAVGLVLGMVLVLLFGAVTIVCTGPFPTAKELFVVSVNETSAVKFLSRIYFTRDEVEEILERNAILVPDEVTDTTRPFPFAEQTASDEIEIVEVLGSTYKGKMMIVHDPSRMQLATLPTFGNEVRGKRIEEFVADAGAVAGINAGGFADEGGVGKGGMPLGLVIHEGQITSGHADTECNLIGFDEDNRLVVGMMSGRQALEMGVRDAVHFEPTLIVNGKPAEVSGTGGGLNPRTVIGQRADGTVLLLVIDGRQPHSVGATLQDCLQEMLHFGAVNAANLDGGSSSMMVYEGEVINVCASLNGSRTQPAAWLVV
ncbi:phosphodiester glycosidase family protein, partial [Ruminococcaceae bacterium OttesenSCG-928-I18]|nr:phosphodiester glycosidase family protein [Ruminococcaceae bacterium OttesenSCG-928-I18]